MTQYSTQILKTLQDQIQNLTPLRQSYTHLESYYSKLTKDFNDLLVYGKRSQVELTTKLKSMIEIHRGLQQQYGGCGDQMRQLEYVQAKLIMERDQQIAQNQSLKRRGDLEKTQQSQLLQKQQDLLTFNSQMQFNVCKYKELIHSLELDIKSKQYENIDIEREIQKLELVKSKISQLNQNAVSSIDQIQKSNDKILSELHECQVKLETYNRLVEGKQRSNKQNFELLIAKTEEAEQLRVRKQYVDRLKQTEETQQRTINRNCSEMQSILTVKRQKLEMIGQENKEYELSIQEERIKRQNSKDQLLKLTVYLHSLVQSNEILFKQLQRSCSQDREVQVMLSEKLQKLMAANQKITENQIFNQYNSNIPQIASKMEQNIRLCKNEKERRVSPQINTSAIDKLIEQRMGRSREQMSSTWASFTKENRATFDY